MQAPTEPNCDFEPRSGLGLPELAKPGIAWCAEQLGQLFDHVEQLSELLLSWAFSCLSELTQLGIAYDAEQVGQLFDHVEQLSELLLFWSSSLLSKLSQPGGAWCAEQLSKLPIPQSAPVSPELAEPGNARRQAECWSACCNRGPRNGDHSSAAGDATPGTGRREGADRRASRRGFVAAH